MLHLGKDRVLDGLCHGRLALLGDLANFLVAGKGELRSLGRVAVSGAQRHAWSIAFQVELLGALGCISLPCLHDLLQLSIDVADLAVLGGIGRLGFG